MHNFEASGRCGICSVISDEIFFCLLQFIIVAVIVYHEHIMVTGHLQRNAVPSIVGREDCREHILKLRYLRNKPEDHRSIIVGRILLPLSDSLGVHQVQNLFGKATVTIHIVDGRSTEIHTRLHRNTR